MVANKQKTERRGVVNKSNKKSFDFLVFLAIQPFKSCRIYTQQIKLHLRYQIDISIKKCVRMNYLLTSFESLVMNIFQKNKF